MWKFIKQSVMWGFAGLIAISIWLLIATIYQSGLKAEPPKPLADCSQQTQRAKLIGTLQQQRVIHKIDMPASLPHVYITPRFRALDVDTKRSFLGMILAHEWCAGRGDQLILRDSQSGNRVGQFSAAFGLSLK